MTDPNTPDRGSSADGNVPGMILSEDELIIETELIETGRVRLIKRIQVETVTRTIELRREILEIERIDALASGGSGPTERSVDGADAAAFRAIQSGPLVAGSLREGGVEIVLMQEEALITTQLVPRERVRLGKRIVTEERTIDADLNVERVDIEQRSPEL